MKQRTKNKLAIISFFSIINIQNTTAFESPHYMEPFDIFAIQPMEELNPDQVNYEIANPILEIFEEYQYALNKTSIDISEINFIKDEQNQSGILNCNTENAKLERMRIDSMFQNHPSIIFNKIYKLRNSGYNIRSSEILLNILEKLSYFGNPNEFKNIQSTYYTLADAMFRNDQMPSIDTAYDNINQYLQNEKITKENFLQKITQKDALELWKILDQALFSALDHIKKTKKLRKPSEYTEIINAEYNKEKMDEYIKSSYCRQDILEKRALDYHWYSLNQLIYDLESYTKSFNGDSEIINTKQEILDILVMMSGYCETIELNWAVFIMNRLNGNNNDEYDIYEFFDSNQFIPSYNFKNL